METSFEAALGFTIEGDARGMKVSAVVREEHKNRAGYLHGAVPFAMADSAMGVFLFHTIREERPNHYCMTLEMSSRFVRSAQPGERLVAVPRLIHLGRTTAILEADVRNEADDLVLTAAATFVIREREG